MKTYTITAPEGMMIDESYLKNNEIKFVAEKKELPKEWKLEEEKDYWYIENDSDISDTGRMGANVTHGMDKNSLPTKQLAEAMLALCQLLVMRDRYNDGWEPDWNRDDNKYVIESCSGIIGCDVLWRTHKVLAFKDSELRDAFLENFRELIEVAKPLI